MVFFLLMTAITFSLFGFVIGLWADNFENYPNTSNCYNPCILRR